MGRGAQQKFTAANVKVFGAFGTVKEAIDNLVKEELGGLDECREQGNHH